MYGDVKILSIKIFYLILGEMVAENRGLIVNQAPDAGQDRALHGVRRGVGRLQGTCN